jgi:hypothetical protein
MIATPPAEDRPASQTYLPGTAFAAGTLLLTCAVLTLLQGISALVNDQLLLVGPDYVYKFNMTGWGWVHIVVAILLGAVAVGLMFAATWARVAAIAMASVSIVVMFVWLPYYPLWSIIVIALDVIVILAVATWNMARP